MSTPVVTNKWAGSFDCGTCRRKRLMGDEFSKKALERHRKDGKPLKCKLCVASEEQAERDNAAKRKGGDGDSNERRKCSACSQELSQSSFNKNQWSKGENKSRCRKCVEQSIKDESANQAKSKEDKITAARKNVEDAKRSGNPKQILQAESALAALEAERVTGLKPVKLSVGRGRGRSRGGGGRGRGK